MIDLYIELLSLCNLKCIHCYNDSNNTNFDKLDLNLLLHNVKLVSEKYPIENIILSGGEPLLYDELFQLTELLGKYCKKIMIVTNGIKLTKEIYHELKKENIYVSISMDGPDAKSNDKVRGIGTFDKVYSNLKSLQLHPKNDDMQIKTIVTKSNFLLLENFFYLCKSLHIKNLNFGFLDPTGRGNSIYNEFSLSTEERKKFIKELDLCSKRHPSINVTFPDVADICPILDLSNKQTIKIDAQGYIFPCPIIVNKKYAIGNIYSTHLDELLYSNNHINISKIFNKRFMNNDCMKCILNPICKGGCPIFAEYFYGDIFNKDNQCEFRKNRYFNTIYK